MRLKKRSRLRLSLPWWLALGVVLGGLLGTSPLVDAAQGSPVPVAGLDRPFSYLAFAPLFGLWDSLSLLTLHQHYALLATLVVIYLLVRIRVPRTRLSIPGKTGMELIRAVGALALLLAFYVAGMMLPRPMVGLTLADPELLSVDFHSHTNHSHDGWAAFTAEKNRAWHEAGGFDAAYVTDHYTWQGVDEAALSNPRTAGEGTVLLSGAEMKLRDRHTNLLGDRTRYAFALDSTWHHLDPESINRARLRGEPSPTMLYTIPGPLDQIVPFMGGAPAGVVGVELNDGAPRGLEQAKGEREEILALADSMNLAVVAGANLHGWGRTVAAWSVLRIPGWRDMGPLELGDAIESLLHNERRTAVTVVERRMPYHNGSKVKLAATLPWLLWEHLRMLNLGERLSWLLWILVFVVGANVVASQRLPELGRAGYRTPK